MDGRLFEPFALEPFAESVELDHGFLREETNRQQNVSQKLRSRARRSRSSTQKTRHLVCAKFKERFDFLVTLFACREASLVIAYDHCRQLRLNNRKTGVRYSDDLSSFKRNTSFLCFPVNRRKKKNSPLMSHYEKKFRRDSII